MAEKGGYTVGSAHVLYRKTLKKLHGLNNDDALFANAGTGSNATPATPKTPTATTGTPSRGKGTGSENKSRRRTAAVANADANPDDSFIDTPTKRIKKMPAKPKRSTTSMKSE
jgi:hypothetical protein